MKSNKPLSIKLCLCVAYIIASSPNITTPDYTRKHCRMSLQRQLGNAIRVFGISLACLPSCNVKSASLLADVGIAYHWLVKPPSDTQTCEVVRLAWPVTEVHNFAVK